MISSFIQARFPATGWLISDTGGVEIQWRFITPSSDAAVHLVKGWQSDLPLARFGIANHTSYVASRAISITQKTFLSCRLRAQLLRPLFSRCRLEYTEFTSLVLFYGIDPGT